MLGGSELEVEGRARNEVAELVKGTCVGANARGIGAARRALEGGPIARELLEPRLGQVLGASDADSRVGFVLPGARDLGSWHALRAISTRFALQPLCSRTTVSENRMDDRVVREGLAERAWLPDWLLQHLLKHKDSQLHLARRLGLSDEALCSIARNGAQDAAVAVAERTGLSKAVKAALLQRRSKVINRALLCQQLEPSELEEVARHATPEVADLARARNPETPGWVLAALVANPLSERIIESVALNPSTPELTLRHLHSSHPWLTPKP